MPRYDYQCAACGRRFEVVHGLHDDGPASCPLCGAGPVRKAFAAPAIHFKGSGWAKKERRATKAPAGADGPTEHAPAATSGAGASATNGTGATTGSSGGSTDTATASGSGGD